MDIFGWFLVMFRKWWEVVLVFKICSATNSDFWVKIEEFRNSEHSFSNLFFQMQKLHLTYNYFFLAVENGCTYQKMSVISRSSHWKFTFSIDKLCRFFFLRSFLQWRILKNWMQSTMQNHRKEKCWHNKEMGLELKMLSSIQRKCHEMNFKRNDNFLACLHTMPFWWNLRHLSSYKK